ncbi:hypothetical protein GCM10010254_33440 [Streptomyces chromofuscus]|nr:hypothetical protein GCM10010254_33440 [Streptomyces chromofuscus]
MLLRARINGRPLSEEEISYNCMNVAVGGNETSSCTVCSGLQALIGHPDQYDRVLSGPSLLGTAIEEMLRWSSTNACVQRVAHRDVDRAGVRIRKGDFVTLWNVSANRDPEQSAHADRFDVPVRPSGSCPTAPESIAASALRWRTPRWRPSSSDCCPPESASGRRANPARFASASSSARRTCRWNADRRGST